MSRQHEYQQQLALYHEMQDIMGAMKNMAQAEIHKLRRRQQQQQACLASVTEAAQRVHYQQVAAAGTVSGATTSSFQDVYLLIGSERGFCGGFNEALLPHLDTQPPMTRVIVMGSRLLSLLGTRAEHAPFVPGPTSEKQVSSILATTLECFGRLQNEHSKPLKLTAISHAEHELSHTVLFPLPTRFQQPAPKNTAFRHLEPLPTLRQGIENHYLYHALLTVLYTSLYAENHRRLVQMEGALQHLDERSQQMKRRINAQRQEEIVEEIEVIFSATTHYE